MHKLRFTYSAVVATVIIVVFFSLRLIFPPVSIWSYDVFGYHLYLPSLLIHHDPGLKDISWVEKINETYHCSPSLYQISALENGNHVNRFSSGVSVMNLPFFLAGHIIALIFDFQPDGYSEPYQWAINFAGIFYIFFGIWFLRKALNRLFEDKVSAVTLALIFFGSNVFFFCAWGNTMPHVYLFALYSVILWLTIEWDTKPKMLYAAILGLVTGIAVLTRPSELILLAIPLLWGIFGTNTLQSKALKLWKRKKDVLLFFIIFTLTVLPQVIYWKAITGQWIYNSYNDPQSGFDFSNPRFAYILFGFRKGFYVYSPMMIFATIGLYFLYRKKSKALVAIVAFSLITVYLLASYSSLVSYGWRAFLQIHALFAIPLAAFVEWVFTLKKCWKKVLFGLLVLVTLLNIFKSYQTLRKIIDGSRMTREAYFKNFFVIDPKKTDQSLMLVDRPEETIEILKEEENFTNRLLENFDFENYQGGNKEWYSDQISHGGSHSYKLGVDNIYSPAIERPFFTITKSYYAWIRISVWMFKSGEAQENDPLLVVHFSYKDRIYKYRTLSFNDSNLPFIEGQWNKLTLDYMTPEVRTVDDPLKVYVWYRGQGDVFIDDFQVEVFEPK